jgi:hypothetical protein
MRERLRPPFRLLAHRFTGSHASPWLTELMRCTIVIQPARCIVPVRAGLLRCLTASGAGLLQLARALALCLGWLTASQIPRKHRLVAQNKTGHRTRRVSRISFYRVVFQKAGRNVQTLYWNEPLEETRSLARYIAVKCEAGAFQIFDFTGAEVASEKHPFQVPRDSC